MELKEAVDKLQYIRMEIESGNYSILNNSISNGIVYKIHFRGDLNTDYYESGFLFIPKGSGIKKHTHINDIELYRLIDGTLSVLGKTTLDNMCFIGDTHNIDCCNTDTFIETFKVSKEYLNKINFEDSSDKSKSLIKIYNRINMELSL